MVLDAVLRVQAHRSRVVSVESLVEGRCVAFDSVPLRPGDALAFHVDLRDADRQCVDSLPFDAGWSLWIKKLDVHIAAEQVTAAHIALSVPVDDEGIQEALHTRTLKHFEGRLCMNGRPLAPPIMFEVMAASRKTFNLNWRCQVSPTVRRLPDGMLVYSQEGQHVWRLVASERVTDHSEFVLVSLERCFDADGLRVDGVEPVVVRESEDAKSDASQGIIELVAQLHGDSLCEARFTLSMEGIYALRARRGLVVLEQWLRIQNDAPLPTMWGAVVGSQTAKTGDSKGGAHGKSEVVRLAAGFDMTA
jgi:hypothetical protein